MSNEFYINKSIQYLVNKRIYEYDIESAGLNVLKETGVISENTYNLWKRRSKDWIVRHIGLKLNETFKDTNARITQTVDKFIQMNDIPNDAIISRKRDAVFMFNCPVTVLTIDGLRFKLKNTYTSYFKLEEFELYYNSSKDFLVIKGVDTRFVRNHPLMRYIKKCVALYEQLDQKFIFYKEVYNYIHTLRDNYCEYKLSMDCYREIGYGNPFTIYDMNENRMDKYETLPKGDNYEIVITYNFARFITPFIRLLSQYKSHAFRTG
jgi:hypothetical protein